MSITDAVILGAVQGFAEFLPISSSGHLLLIRRWLGYGDIGMFFDIMLHIGTLIPIIIVMYKQILGIFQTPKKILFLIIATIPAVITGLALGDLVEEHFQGSNTLAVALLSATFCLTAIELLVAEYFTKKKKKGLPLNYVNTGVMGLAQGLAIVPGLSRSGTVLSAGCFMNVKREENASFTFLMSIPIILGAALISGIDLIKDGGGLGGIGISSIIVGMLTAMLTGYCAITFMMKLIKDGNYKWFSLYLILISGVNLISFFVFGK